MELKDPPLSHCFGGEQWKCGLEGRKKGCPWEAKVVASRTQVRILSTVKLVRNKDGGVERTSKWTGCGLSEKGGTRMLSSF